jgi:ATP-binding cassette subfamily A (ABC1) protein 3
LLVEKETKMREMLKIMGVSSGALVAASFVMHIAVDVVLSALLALASSGLIYTNTSFGVLFGLYFFFILSLMSWAHFVTAFFSQSMTGSMFGTLTIFGGWFVVSALNSTSTITTIRAVSLLPAAALSLGITIIAEYETYNVGLTGANIAAFQSTQYGNFNFQSIIGMLVFDSIFYALLGWYLDKTWPQEFGTRQPVYFLCLPSYWLPHQGQSGGGGGGSGGDSQALTAARVSGSVASAESELADMEDGVVVDADDFEPVAAELREQEGQGRCVVIRNLRKTFPTPEGIKVAVHGLSVNMYESQVFALLGHNGAGKTTTLSMLEGMLTPDGGDAIIQVVLVSSCVFFFFFFKRARSNTKL